MKPPVRTAKKKSAPPLRAVRQPGARKLTQFIKPMLATIHGKPFDDADWLFEIKWDGYRAVAEISKDGVRLYSRNGLSFAAIYPAVVKALSKIRTDVVLDGEIVVLNESSRPDFQKLQQYYENRSLPILYYVFDCLMIGGKPVMHLPLTERKKLAHQVIPQDSIVKYSDDVRGSGVEFFMKAVEMDLEGIIAKKAGSIYVPGRRSREWLKIKNHNTQEAIIAGYTSPKGSRAYFGALILGIMSHEKLRYIGHTGTGFTAATLKDVHRKLQPYIRATSPFAGRIAVNSPVTWVEPVLVCNIKFTEITQGGILRHPVFTGLRIDKSAQDANTLDVAVKRKAASQKRKSKLKK